MQDVMSSQNRNLLYRLGAYITIRIKSKMLVMPLPQVCYIVQTYLASEKNSLCFKGSQQLLFLS